MVGSNLGSAVLYLTTDETGLISGIAAARGKTLNALERIGRDSRLAGLIISAAVTAPLVGTAALAVKSQLEFESAFAGVQKTAEGTVEQFNELRDAILNMSTTLPTAAKDIADIAMVGGQLGIPIELLQEFTKVAIDLGNATTLTAEQAITGLTRFMNVMGTAQGSVREVADVLVELGNEGASTEKEILDFAQRLAGAGRQINLTERDILGMANGLASLGIRAEAGGSSFSRVFMQMAQAADSGGEELEAFGKIAFGSIAGAGDQFATLLRTDPSAAVLAFVGGLERIRKEGGSVFDALESVDLQTIRLRNSILLAAGGLPTLAASMQRSNDTLETNNALGIEAEKRYSTAASQLAMLRNRVVKVAIAFGGDLVPAMIIFLNLIAPFIEKVGKVVEGFGGWSSGAKVAAFGVGILVASLGPLLFIAGSILAAWVPVIVMFRVLTGYGAKLAASKALARAQAAAAKAQAKPAPARTATAQEVLDARAMRSAARVPTMDAEQRRAQAAVQSSQQRLRDLRAAEDRARIRVQTAPTIAADAERRAAAASANGAANADAMQARAIRQRAVSDAAPNALLSRQRAIEQQQKQFDVDVKREMERESQLRLARAQAARDAERALPVGTKATQATQVNTTATQANMRATQLRAAADLAGAKSRQTLTHATELGRRATEAERVALTASTVAVRQRNAAGQFTGGSTSPADTANATATRLRSEANRSLAQAQLLSRNASVLGNAATQAETVTQIASKSAVDLKSLALNNSTTRVVANTAATRGLTAAIAANTLASAVSVARFALSNAGLIVLGITLAATALLWKKMSAAMDEATLKQESQLRAGKVGALGGAEGVKKEIVEVTDAWDQARNKLQQLRDEREAYIAWAVKETPSVPVTTIVQTADFKYGDQIKAAEGDLAGLKADLGALALEAANLDEQAAIAAKSAGDLAAGIASVRDVTTEDPLVGGVSWIDALSDQFADLTTEALAAKYAIELARREGGMELTEAGREQDIIAASGKALSEDAPEDFWTRPRTQPFDLEKATREIEAILDKKFDRDYRKARRTEDLILGANGAYWREAMDSINPSKEAEGPKTEAEKYATARDREQAQAVFKQLPGFENASREIGNILQSTASDVDKVRQQWAVLDLLWLNEAIPALQALGLAADETFHDDFESAVKALKDTDALLAKRREQVAEATISDLPGIEKLKKDLADTVTPQLGDNVKELKNQFELLDNYWTQIAVPGLKAANIEIQEGTRAAFDGIATEILNGKAKVQQATSGLSGFIEQLATRYLATTGQLPTGVRINPDFNPSKSNGTTLTVQNMVFNGALKATEPGGIDVPVAKVMIRESVEEALAGR